MTQKKKLPFRVRKGNLGRESYFAFSRHSMTVNATSKKKSYDQTLIVWKIIKWNRKSVILLNANGTKYFIRVKDNKFTIPDSKFEVLTY